MKKFLTAILLISSHAFSQTPIVVSPTTQTQTISVPTTINLTSAQVTAIQSALAGLSQPITFSSSDGSKVHSIQITIMSDGSAVASIVFVKP